jgi:hypothetical protein
MITLLIGLTQTECTASDDDFRTALEADSCALSVRYLSPARDTLRGQLAWPAPPDEALDVPEGGVLWVPLRGGLEGVRVDVDRCVCP